MAQILHPSARTTAAVRFEIQHSQESIAALARRLDLNPKTVAKWKKRSTTTDAAMGPKAPRSTSLTPQEEAAALAFRKHTLLPLDDCLYALQESIPSLTRSSLHRLFQRHGVSRLPSAEAEKKVTKKHFKPYPVGFVHIDIAEVSTAQGKAFLFVAIDRASKYCFVQLQERQTKMIAAQFLTDLANTVPFRIETILTDNGIQFTNRLQDRYAGEHIFDRVCRERTIEHRLTKINHPWTNGQVQRMNRTIKEATVNPFFYDTYKQLESHLKTFITAYNFGKRLKALHGQTPFEKLCSTWKEEPARFIHDPNHHTPGLYT